MKIELSKFEKDSIALPKSVKTAKGLISKRPRFTIWLKDERGNMAFGEAFPLDGFSFEDEKSTENKLRELVKKSIFENRDFQTFRQFEQDSNGLLKNFPTLVFAFEQAFLKLAGLRKMPLTEISDLTDSKMEIRIKTAGLVSTDNKDFFYEIEELIERGFNTVKIKIGDNFEPEKLNDLKTFGKTVRFRFDPNGTWNYDEARKKIDFLTKLNCDFVEDPTNDLRTNMKLFDEFGNFVAIDLTARKISQFKEALDYGINVLVVKPSFLGGLLETLDFIGLAKAKGTRVIISSAFETDTAKNFVALAATAVSEETHGLAGGNKTSFFKLNCNNIFRQ